MEHEEYDDIDEIRDRTKRIETKLSMLLEFLGVNPRNGEKIPTQASRPGPKVWRFGGDS